MRQESGLRAQCHTGSDAETLTGVVEDIIFEDDKITSLPILPPKAELFRFKCEF
jgi:hypothetical protein